jgi:transcriptional regulator with XRE-family HTH domain
MPENMGYPTTVKRNLTQLAEGGGVRAIKGLGARLNDLLFRRGISRTQLAERSGVSRDRVQAALRGEATGKTVKKLAAALDVSDEFLLTGEGGYQWEPGAESGAVSEPSAEGAQLEEFLSDFDRIVRTLRNFPGGELGTRLKIGFLNAVEDVARETGNKLPMEFYELRKRVSDGEL